MCRVLWSDYWREQRGLSLSASLARPPAASSSTRHSSSNPNPNPNPTPNPNPSPSLSPNPNPSPSPSPGLNPSSYAGQESCMSRLDGPLSVAPRVVTRRARCASAAGCSSAIAAVRQKVRGASGRLS